jgi:hypothetical protein
MTTTTMLYKPEILHTLSNTGLPGDLLQDVTSFAGRPTYVDSGFKGEVYIRSVLSTMNGHMREYFAENDHIPLLPSETWLQSCREERRDIVLSDYITKKTAYVFRKKTLKKMRKAIGVLLDDYDTHKDFLHTYDGKMDVPHIVFKDHKIQLECQTETMHSLYKRLNVYWDILDMAINNLEFYNPPPSGLYDIYY